MKKGLVIALLIYVLILVPGVNSAQGCCTSQISGCESNVDQSSCQEDPTNPDLIQFYSGQLCSDKGSAGNSLPGTSCEIGCCCVQRGTDQYEPLPDVQRVQCVGEDNQKPFSVESLGQAACSTYCAQELPSSCTQLSCQSGNIVGCACTSSPTVNSVKTETSKLFCCDKTALSYPDARSCSAACGSTTTYAISGTVSGSLTVSDPTFSSLPGATVTAEGENKQTSSAGDGTFSLPELLPGTHILIASKQHYESQRKVVVIESTDKPNIEFNLLPAASQTPETCSGAASCTTCTNAADDDNDGFFDQCDGGCNNGVNVESMRNKGGPRAERDEITCSNARDDDCDGTTDCTDIDCASLPVCLQAPVCGNQRLEYGEECDPGPTAGSDDDISPYCPGACGQKESDTPCRCPTVCGNGLIQGNEACDVEGYNNDGTIRGNGNDIACRGLCTAAGQEGECQCSTAQAICGNGRIEGTETCETDSQCASGVCIDPGVLNACSCQLPHCGNGVWEPSLEQCEDNNFDNNDKCTNACRYGPMSCDGIASSSSTKVRSPLILDENGIIKPTRGKRELIVRFQAQDCSPSSYRIYRCTVTTGSEDCVPQSWIKTITPPEVTSPSFTYSYTDTGRSHTFAYNTKYCYSVGAVFAGDVEHKSLPKCGEIGDSQCYSTKYRLNQDVNFQYCNNGRTPEGTRLSDVMECDAANKKSLKESCISESKKEACRLTKQVSERVLTQTAACYPPSPCEKCGNPFGMFSRDAKTTVGTGSTTAACTDAERLFCYYDTSFTAVDKYSSCSNIDSCYDYRSKKACENDRTTCKIDGGCQWRESEYKEFGVGVCIPNEVEQQDCSKCNDPKNIVFGQCDKSMCKLYGHPEDGCYLAAQECTAKKELTCSNYDSEEDCGTIPRDLDVVYSGGGKRTEGTNRFIERSSDFLHFGTCAWIEDSCIKDADEDEREDSLSCVDTTTDEKDRLCASDMTSPITSLDLPKVVGKTINADFSVNEENTMTYFSVVKRDNRGSYPFLYPTVPMQTQERSTLVWPGIRESGEYAIYFYSIDKNHNLEYPVKSALTYIDANAPQINLQIAKTEKESLGVFTTDVSITVTLFDDTADAVTCTTSFKKDGIDQAIAENPDIADTNLPTGTAHIYNYPDAVDGLYTFAIECNDGNGNSRLDVKNLLLNADKTITLTRPASGRETISVLNFPLTITTANPSICRYTSVLLPSSPVSFIQTGETNHNTLLRFSDPSERMPPIGNPFVIHKHSYQEYRIECDKMDSVLGDFVGDERVRITVDQEPSFANATFDSQNEYQNTLWHDASSVTLNLFCNDPSAIVGYQTFGCKELCYCITAPGGTCNPMVTSGTNQACRTVASDQVFNELQSTDVVFSCPENQECELQREVIVQTKDKWGNNKENNDVFHVNIDTQEPKYTLEIIDLLTDVPVKELYHLDQSRYMVQIVTTEPLFSQHPATDPCRSETDPIKRCKNGVEELVFIAGGQRIELSNRVSKTSGEGISNEVWEARFGIDEFQSSILDENAHFDIQLFDSHGVLGTEENIPIPTPPNFLETNKFKVDTQPVDEPQLDPSISTLEQLGYLQTINDIHYTNYSKLIFSGFTSKPLSTIRFYLSPTIDITAPFAVLENDLNTEYTEETHAQKKTVLQIVQPSAALSRTILARETITEPPGIAMNDYIAIASKERAYPNFLEHYKITAISAQGLNSQLTLDPVLELPVQSEQITVFHKLRKENKFKVSLPQIQLPSFRTESFIPAHNYLKLVGYRTLSQQSVPSQFFDFFYDATPPFFDGHNIPGTTNNRNFDIEINISELNSGSEIDWDTLEVRMDNSIISSGSDYTVTVDPVNANNPRTKDIKKIYTLTITKALADSSLQVKDGIIDIFLQDNAMNILDTRTITDDNQKIRYHFDSNAPRPPSSLIFCKTGDCSQPMPVKEGTHFISQSMTTPQFKAIFPDQVELVSAEFRKVETVNEIPTEIIIPTPLPQMIDEDINANDNKKFLFTIPSSTNIRAEDVLHHEGEYTLWVNATLLTKTQDAFFNYNVVVDNTLPRFYQLALDDEEEVVEGVDYGFVVPEGIRPGQPLLFEVRRVVEIHDPKVIFSYTSTSSRLPARLFIEVPLTAQRQLSDVDLFTFGNTIPIPRDAEGSITLNGKIEDAVGNELILPPKTVIIDNTPPQFTASSITCVQDAQSPCTGFRQDSKTVLGLVQHYVTTAPGAKTLKISGTVQDAAKLTWEVNEGVEQELDLDQNQYEIVFPVTVLSSDEQFFEFRLHARDKAGNVAEKILPLTIDTKGPVVQAIQINDQDSSEILLRAAVFDIEFGEEVNDVVAEIFNTSNQREVLLPPPRQFEDTFTYRSNPNPLLLKNEDYVLAVSAKDWLGNPSHPREEFQFSMNAPTTTIDLLKPRHGLSSTQTTLVEVETSRDAQCQYSLSDLEDPQATFISFGTGKIHTLSNFALSSTPTNFNIQCNDNVETVTSGFQLIHDSVVPLVTVNANPQIIRETSNGRIITTLEVAASEPVICKYSDLDSTPYVSMTYFTDNDPNQLDSFQGNQVHRYDATGKQIGSQQHVFVQCEDRAGATSLKHDIAYSIESAPLTITKKSPLPIVGESPFSLGVETNKDARCRYLYSRGSSRSSQILFQSDTLEKRIHTTPVSLEQSGEYDFLVSCQATRGIPAGGSPQTENAEIRFSLLYDTEDPIVTEVRHNNAICPTNGAYPLNPTIVASDEGTGIQKYFYKVVDEDGIVKIPLTETSTPTPTMSIVISAGKKITILSSVVDKANRPSNEEESEEITSFSAASAFCNDEGPPTSGLSINANIPWRKELTIQCSDPPDSKGRSTGCNPSTFRYGLGDQESCIPTLLYQSPIRIFEDAIVCFRVCDNTNNCIINEQSIEVEHGNEPTTITLVKPNNGYTTSSAVEFEVETSRYADCRYSQNANPVESQFTPFLNTGIIQNVLRHTASLDVPIESLVSVRCFDGLETVNNQFMIIRDGAIPVIESASITPSDLSELTNGKLLTTISATTNEDTVCEAEGTNFESENPEDLSSYTRSHSLIYEVTKGVGSYFLSLRCKDKAGQFSLVRSIPYSVRDDFLLINFEEPKGFKTELPISIIATTSVRSTCNFTLDNGEPVDFSSDSTERTIHNYDLDVLNEGSHTIRIVCSTGLFFSEDRKAKVATRDATFFYDGTAPVIVTLDHEDKICPLDTSNTYAFRPQIDAQDITSGILNYTVRLIKQPDIVLKTMESFTSAIEFTKTVPPATALKLTSFVYDTAGLKSQEIGSPEILTMARTSAFCLDEGPPQTSISINQFDGRSEVGILCTDPPDSKNRFSDCNEAATVYGLANAESPCSKTIPYDGRKIVLFEPKTICWKVCDNANNCVENEEFVDVNQADEMSIQLQSPPHGYSTIKQFPVSVGTSEFATCKYSLSEVPVSLRLFDDTGFLNNKLEHTIHQVTVQESVPFFVSCNNGKVDTTELFTLVYDNTPPRILSANARPSIINENINGITSTLIEATTDEDTVCSIFPSNQAGIEGVPFDSEQSDDARNFRKHHSTTYETILPEGDYSIYIECVDKSSLKSQRREVQYSIRNQNLQVTIDSPSDIVSSSELSIVVQTNKFATCTYSINGEEDATLSIQEQKTHTKDIELDQDIVLNTLRVDCTSLGTLNGEEIQTASAEVLFTLDTSRPVFEEILVADKICKIDARYKIHAIFVANDDAGIFGYNYTLTDLSNKLIIKNTFSGSEKVIVDAPLETPKEYTLKASVTDRASKVSDIFTSDPIKALSITDPFCTERTPPSTDLKISIVNTGVTVEILCSDSGSGCDKGRFSYGISEGSCTSDIPYIPPVLMSQSMNFCWQVCDIAGNCANDNRFIRVPVPGDRQDPTLRGIIVPDAVCPTADAYLFSPIFDAIDDKAVEGVKYKILTSDNTAFHQETFTPLLQPNILAFFEPLASYTIEARAIDTSFKESSSRRSDPIVALAESNPLCRETIEPRTSLLLTQDSGGVNARIECNDLESGCDESSYKYGLAFEDCSIQKPYSSPVKITTNSTMCWEVCDIAGNCVQDEQEILIHSTIDSELPTLDTINVAPNVCPLNGQYVLSPAFIAHDNFGIFGYRYTIIDNQNTALIPFTTTQNPSPEIRIDLDQTKQYRFKAIAIDTSYKESLEKTSVSITPLSESHEFCIERSPPTTDIQIISNASGATVSILCNDAESGCNPGSFTYGTSDSTCVRTTPYISSILLRSTKIFCWEVCDVARNCASGTRRIAVDPTDATQIRLNAPPLGRSQTPQFNVRVETSRNAECKYTTNPDLATAELSAFETSGQTSHRLDNYQIHTSANDPEIFNVKCRDDIEDVVAQFSLVYDNQAPVITSGRLEPALITQKLRGALSTKIIIDTSEPTVCKLTPNVLLNYTQMSYFETETNQLIEKFSTHHEQSINVTNQPEGEYSIYIQCEDAAALQTEKRDLRYEIRNVPLSISIAKPDDTVGDVITSLFATTNKLSLCKYTLDTQTEQSLNEQSPGLINHTATLTLQPVRDHTIKLKCTSYFNLTGSDNEVVELTKAFKYDNDLPLLSAIVADNQTCEGGNSLYDITVRFTASDNTSQLAGFNYTLLDNSADIVTPKRFSSSSTARISANLTPGDTYVILGTVFDQAGRESEEQESNLIRAYGRRSPECTESVPPTTSILVRRSRQGANVTIKCEDNVGCDSSTYRYGLSYSSSCYLSESYNKSVFLTDSQQMCWKVCDINGNCVDDQKLVEVELDDDDGDDVPNCGEDGCCKTDRTCTDSNDDDKCPNTPVDEEADQTGCSDSQKPSDDTDVDGLKDSCEDANGNKKYDSPSETDGKNKDTDNDSLDDGVEDTNHNCRVDEGETDPRKSDTDGDTLPDGWEVKNDLNPNDPSDALVDTDNDGMTNKEEFDFDPKLDPQNPDTDNDGINDGTEVDQGSDPLDPDSPNAKPSVEEKPEADNTLSLIIMILGLMLIIAGVLYLAYKKTKKKTPVLPRYVISDTPLTEGPAPRPPQQSFVDLKKRLKEKEDARKRVFSDFSFTPKTEEKKKEEVSKKPVQQEEEEKGKVTSDIFARLKSIGDKKKDSFDKIDDFVKYKPLDLEEEGDTDSNVFDTLSDFNKMRKLTKGAAGIVATLAKQKSLKPKDIVAQLTGVDNKQTIVSVLLALQKRKIISRHDSIVVLLTLKDKGVMTRKDVTEIVTRLPA